MWQIFFFFYLERHKWPRRGRQLYGVQRLWEVFQDLRDDEGQVCQDVQIHNQCWHFLVL